MYLNTYQSDYAKGVQRLIDSEKTLSRRIAELEQQLAELQKRIHEAQEVYAGMDGFIPETAPEAYCLRIIDEMNKALLEEPTK